MTEGVPAGNLSADDLRRELAHLKETQDHVAVHGTAHQQSNHQSRTAELEREFLRRFAAEDQPGRTENPPDDEWGPDDGHDATANESTTDDRSARPPTT